MRPDTLLARFAYAAAAFGVSAGVIGPTTLGYNIQGIATGLYLAALAIMINDA